MSDLPRPDEPAARPGADPPGAELGVGGAPLAGRWPAWLPVERRQALRRAVKVALAAVVATAIARVLQLPVPWFATLAAVTAVEITLRVSMVAARNAIVGAAAGALIGLGLAEVAKDRLWAVGVAVLVPSIVFGLARMEPIARQAALVASVIVLIPVETQLTTPEFAAVRFAETVIGILVALLVNATVLPPRAHRGARRHLGLAIGHLATLYRLVTDAVAGGFRDEAAIVATRRSFRSELAQVDALWDEAMAESPGPDELGPGWRTATRRMWEQCTAMDDAVARVGVDRALLTPGGPGEELTAATRRAFAHLTSSLLDDDRGLPRIDDLDAPRQALLDELRRAGADPTRSPLVAPTTGDASVESALAGLVFVSAMSAIAAHLGDLAGHELLDGTGSAHEPTPGR